VNLPGADIFTALQTGSIDATEWIGPYNDVAFGLHKAARYYYYPGWQEPGPVLECTVNKEAYESLPEDLQAIIQIACSATNDQMTAEFVARNAQSLAQLRTEGEVEFRSFPPDVLTELRALTDQVIKVYASWSAYRDRAQDWTALSEQAMLNTRP
jgi:TRAP-type mannitol/chloroaromatic compound transport system substrate-binding protein